MVKFYFYQQPQIFGNHAIVYHDYYRYARQDQKIFAPFLSYFQKTIFKWQFYQKKFMTIFEKKTISNGKGKVNCRW